ncbi:MAG TPA: universal stress protein [Armatimonadota bacterium]|nr:universal stress protein [Armatimonadota bacterium]
MFESILLPTDGSACSLRAAEYCADIAKKYGSNVTVLYVAELPPVIGPPPSEEKQMDMRLELSRHGRAALEAAREVLEMVDIDPREELVFGSAVPDILQYAREGSYGLIVIGSRGAGTGAIGQILIGSVAEGILHGAPCPVLMVRPS